ncbi:hypothetical protein M2137_001078 [Parabacteroides sp. PFB2-10]|nr:hypothetical protein [Parabacteroides sp. PFB2-10]
MRRTQRNTMDIFALSAHCQFILTLDKIFIFYCCDRFAYLYNVCLKMGGIQVWENVKVIEITIQGSPS